MPAYAFEAVEAPPRIVSLKDRAKAIAEEYDIKYEHLEALVQCESSWDPLADNGHDRGLVQINRTAWPDITDEQAFDPDWSLRWASQKIKEGKGEMWVCGNCYATAKLKIDLPKMAEILPNTIHPVIGGLIIFDYNGLKHIAVVLEVKKEGILVFEGNYKPYTIEKRLVSWDDKAIVGYWRSTSKE